MSVEGQASDDTASRPPAPGDLALLQAFVNTADIEAKTEELRGPAQLREWLAGWELVRADEAIDEEGFRRAIELRETIRALAYANHDEQVDDSAADRLDRLAAGLRLEVRFAGSRSRLEPAASGVDGALARFVGAIYTAMADGSWSRFKACRRDTCRWVFYDRSRNHSSAWCSMAPCGNKEKAKAFRRRQKLRESSARV